MSEPARRSPRFDELYAALCDAPENLVGEIIDGELFLSPRPRYRHARANGRLARRIERMFDPDPDDPGPGGWWILTEPEVHFPHRVVVPDLAGWRRERMPQIPDEAWTSLEPDWVCEVLSPSTERLDRGKKQRVYAQAHVPWLWFVNPTLKMVEVHQLTGDLYVRTAFFEGDAKMRAAPFEALEIDLSTVWLPG